MTTKDVQRFHYLYERVSADLARIATFSSEREIRRYLESLVARAYGEIHETRDRPCRLRPRHWLTRTLPRTFRRHARAFALAAAVTAAGALFGIAIITLVPSSKSVIMPFANLMQSPAERVAHEETIAHDAMEGTKARASAWYFRHNTQVSLLAMALGISWGVGTLVLLLGNGIILGAVFADFVGAGETPFIFGWLLPHGSVEIPAILIAGQAGFVLASAVIGWGKSLTLNERFRTIAPDVVTLVLGAVLLLAWAGFIEACLSQYHEPTIPYSLKIGFGAIQLLLLTAFLIRSGRTADKNE